MSTQWMASGDTPQGKDKPLQGAVLLNSLKSVFRTRGSIAATIR